jgi:FeS assembly SUF system protein
MDGTAHNAAANPFAGLDIENKVVDVLRTVYDPEIPVNIYELGLVYDVQVDGNGTVNIRMTLTSPMCPVAGSLPLEVEEKVRKIPGVTRVNVDVVWDPPWNPDMMSEAARLELGFF